ncbi:MAG TPA: hypothetical protein VFQ61_14100 [Polyangiaceae bacterium]|nr:hypothetical protein [Polyangiaceae bacterium]
MSCLDMPGITDLGRYGATSAGEEESVANCFEAPSDYAELVQSPESGIELSIEDAFVVDQRAGLNANLTSLVPWLPHVGIHNDRNQKLTARVTLKEARFVTLVGLASKLQGQKRERQCLEALCRADYTYVQKALVGIPSVVIRAENSTGKSAELGAWAVSGDFAQRELSSGARELTSNKPVTLAIARGAFRTPQTERLCQFCGKRGQGCCAEAPSCDGGLACIANQCVEVGGPGQPCDGESCSAGATCVRGRCELECGGRGQPCCGTSECSGRLRCAEDPEDGLEHSVASQDVSVGGGFFGTSEDRTFGSASCGPLMRRQRFAVTKVAEGRGDCQKAWWFDPKNERDCRVAVHFEVSTFGTASCHVDVFALKPPKPRRCSP